MSVRAVFFDCAQTLMDVRYDAVEVALEAAEACGFVLDATAGPKYESLVRQRWVEYVRVNRTGDDARCRAFWSELTQEWVVACGLEPSAVEPLIAQADHMLFGPSPSFLTLYPDTEPCLATLHGSGLRLAVLSNWDYTLDRALATFGLQRYFERTFASMVVGYEKPDPRLFLHALDEMGLEPDQVLHVGDNPLADGQGARDAGIECILVDRAAPGSGPRLVRSLAELPARVRL